MLEENSCEANGRLRDQSDVTCSARGWERDSPFLRIPPGWRFVIVAFIVLYEWLFPTIAALGSPDADTLFLPRVLTQLVYVLLLCLPLIFYRREYGFLHPLILPTLFGLLRGVGQLLPYTVIDPLQFPLVSFDVSSLSSAVSLQTLSHHDLAWTRLEYQGVQVLALVCLYAGYFSLRRLRPSRIRFNPPRNLGAYLLRSDDGLCPDRLCFHRVARRADELHRRATRRTPRFAHRKRPVSRGRAFAVLPVLVWFAYRPRSFLNPWWLVALVAGNSSPRSSSPAHGRRSSFHSLSCCS